MLNLLREHCPELARMPAGDGEVLLAASLGGRVFCALGGELAHRLDGKLLAGGQTGNFRNLGGNSLWPAPEGGAFAWNYRPGTAEWHVPDAVSEQACEIISQTSYSATLQKTIALTNRKGASARFVFRRAVSVGAAPAQARACHREGRAPSCSGGADDARQDWPTWKSALPDTPAGARALQRQPECLPADWRATQQQKECSAEQAQVCQGLLEGWGEEFAVVAYASEDSFIPLDECGAEEMLIAPWSLEQFVGGEGVTAFVVCDNPRAALNFDFYGMPETRPKYLDQYLLLPLGGKEKFQVGVKAGCNPKVIGAFDRKRGRLFLRQCEPAPGRYFNIADNEQPQGPWSAADQYSIFSGGALGFFELETIGALCAGGDRLAASTLFSQTVIARGRPEDLAEALRQRLGVEIDV